MKSIKRILISLAVAAMAMAGTQAATLNDNYVSTDNKVFSTSHVIYIDVANEKMTITYENFVSGSANYFADAGGVNANKMLTSGRWIRDTQTGRLYNVGQAHTILCNNGATTLYFLGPYSTLPLIDPGCVIYDQIKAKSN